MKNQKQKKLESFFKRSFMIKKDMLMMKRWNDTIITFIQASTTMKINSKLIDKSKCFLIFSKTFVYFLILLNWVLFSYITLSSIHANERTEKIYYLKIEGMTCSSCSKAIEKTVKRLPGVLEIKVDHQKGEGKVQIDSKKTKIEKIKDVIESIGYKVVQYREILSN